MFLVVAAAKGKTAALDRETCGCVGGAVGILLYLEAQAEQPRATVGLIDISARQVS